MGGGGQNGIFETASSGIKFRKDNLLVQPSIEKIKEMLCDMQELESEKILAKYHFNETNDWNIKTQRQNFINAKDSDIISLAYRPFDIQYCYYPLEKINKIIPRGDSRKKLMQHFIKGENLGICFTKDYQADFYDGILISNLPIDIHYNGGQGYIAPLYLYQDSAKEVGEVSKIVNFTQEFKSYCQSHKILKHKSPEQILSFIYANLFNPAYRIKYLEYLKIGFPRINFEVDSKTFETLESLGSKLINLHLFKEIPQDSSIELKFRENANKSNPSYTIAKLSREKRFCDSKLILNEDLEICNVSEEIFNYRIGGYAVLEKFLSYRKNYTMNKVELEHLVQICKVIWQTLQIQQELKNL